MLRETLSSTFYWPSFFERQHHATCSFRLSNMYIHNMHMWPECRNCADIRISKPAGAEKKASVRNRMSPPPNAAATPSQAHKLIEPAPSKAAPTEPLAAVAAAPFVKVWRKASRKAPAKHAPQAVQGVHSRRQGPMCRDKVPRGGRTCAMHKVRIS